MSNNLKNALPKYFKRIKFDVIDGVNLISTREGKNVSIEEAIEILSDPRVIKVTAVRMTPTESFAFMREWVAQLKPEERRDS